MSSLSNHLLFSPLYLRCLHTTCSPFSPATAVHHCLPAAIVTARVPVCVDVHVLVWFGFRSLRRSDSLPTTDTPAWTFLLWFTFAFQFRFCWFLATCCHLGSYTCGLPARHLTAAATHAAVVRHRAVVSFSAHCILPSARLAIRFISRTGPATTCRTFLPATITAYYLHHTDDFSAAPVCFLPFTAFSYLPYNHIGSSFDRFGSSGFVYHWFCLLLLLHPHYSAVFGSHTTFLPVRCLFFFLPILHHHRTLPPFCVFGTVSITPHLLYLPF